MKIKNIFFLLASLASISCYSQSPDFDWARVLGNAGGTAGAAVTLDGAGNSYAGGIYSTPVTIGGTVLSNPGGGSFLAKFDGAGNGVWVKDLPALKGFQDDTNPDKIIVDDQGNVYFTATYYQASQIDGLALPAPAVFGAYCLVKLDPLGNAQWIRVADVQHNNVDITPSIRFDPQGNICFAGFYENEVVLDGGLSLMSSVPGAMDAFVCTYDTAGSLLRRKTLGPSTNPANYSWRETLRMDAQGNLYRFMPDSWKVIKYDTSGQAILTKTVSITGTVGTCMAVDDGGNIFLGGYSYQQGATLEGNIIPPVSNGPQTDALLFKLDASGNLAWYRQYQYALCDDYRQIRTDALGSVYGFGGHSDCIGGQPRALIIKYDKDGALMWQDSIEPGPLPTPTSPPGQIVPYNIVQANNGGNIIAVGYFKVRIKFDPVTSFSIPDGNYIYRMFIAKYGVCNTPAPTLTAGDTEFCEGDSAELSAAGGSNYQWSTGDTTVSIYVTEPGSYYVLSVESEECYGQSASVLMNALSLPDDSVTQSGLLLTAVATGTGYQWIDCSDGSDIIGETSQSFTASEDGSYAVIITGINGCEAKSQCFTVAGIGLEENDMEGVMLFPNPANDYIRLEPEMPATISDATGRQMLVHNGVGTIDISALAPGIYFIVAGSGQERIVKKFIRR